jgi:DNA polymerase delta subunit 3
MIPDAKEGFEEITTIFVYSLQPGSLQDVEILTETKRQVIDRFLAEDPLEMYKTYGIHQNPNVRRRTGGRKPPPLAAPAAAVTKTAPKPAAKEPIPLSTNSRQNSASSQKSTLQTTTGPKAKPATLKRENSDLFKSFAKSKPPKAKDTSKEASPAADEPMKGMSEDENDDDDFDMAGTAEVDEAKAETARAEREARLKRLRDMMDDDDEDEPMADVPTVEQAVDDGSPIDVTPVAVEEPKESVTVSGGRRRGRRRVMKKKTIEDEEGYLGTL